MVDFYGDDKGNRIIGAAEKRLKAQKYNSASRHASGSNNKKISPAIAIVMTFVIACGFAMLLTDGPIKTGLDLALSPAIDPYLFGPGNPVIMGDAAMDRLIAVLIRGLAIFAVMGIPSLVTAIWQSMLYKQNLSPYVAMWLTMVALPMLGYICFFVF